MCDIEMTQTVIKYKKGCAILIQKLYANIHKTDNSKTNILRRVT